MKQSILSCETCAPPENSYGTLLHEWTSIPPPHFVLYPLSPFSLRSVSLSSPQSMHCQRLKRPPEGPAITIST